MQGDEQLIPGSPVRDAPAKGGERMRVKTQVKAGGTPLPA
jgi:hypothetical protein